MIDADVLENTPNFQGKPYGLWRHFRSKGHTRVDIAQLPVVHAHIIPQRGLRMRAPKGIPFGALPVVLSVMRTFCTTTLVRKKRGKTPGMRRTYFRVRPGPLLVTSLTSLPVTWLPVAPPPQIWFEIISNCNMETPKKRLNKYWYSVPHYLSDIRNIYIKGRSFSFHDADSR